MKLCDIINWVIVLNGKTEMRYKILRKKYLIIISSYSLFPGLIDHCMQYIHQCNLHLQVRTRKKKERRRQILVKCTSYFSVPWRSTDGKQNHKYLRARAYYKATTLCSFIDSISTDNVLNPSPSPLGVLLTPSPLGVFLTAFPTWCPSHPHDTPQFDSLASYNDVCLIVVLLYSGAKRTMQCWPQISIR